MRGHSTGGTCPEHKQSVKAGVRGGPALFGITYAMGGVVAPRNASKNREWLR
jgi:hypothetical protein